MPKRILPLTEIKVRNAKPQNRDYKLFDGGGLFLLVTPSGGKLWRFRYVFDKKEKKLALGSYPEITLLDARIRRDTARSQLAHGLDPSAIIKEHKRAETQETEIFEAVAREWHKRFYSTWSLKYAETVLSRLELYIFPWIGKRPIVKITPPEFLSVLRRMESAGILDTAHRVRMICSQIFRYAVVTGRIERDPTTDLKGALPQPKKKHRSAITDPKEAGALLRAIDVYQGSFVVRCALKLAPLTFVRPGELQNAEWEEISFENAEWNIPGHKMKMKEPHLVPLSKQAIDTLKELYKLTGSGRYVFPGRTSKRPMSNNAILAALRNMGFSKEEMTPHGFRAMARTILDEVLHIRPDYIEHQLAHAVRDPNGRAYNRTAHLVERRKMMQQWADYLDQLKAGAKVIPFNNSQR